MDLFEHLGTVLKPHAELVSKGADSEQVTKPIPCQRRKLFKSHPVTTLRRRKERK